MATLATITVNDGLETPEARAFSVSNIEPRVITYSAKDHPAAHTIEGRPTISIGNRPVTNSNGNYKCTLRVKVPALEESMLSNEPASTHTIKYVMTANLDFILPGKATDADVKDVLAYLQGALANAQFQDTVLEQLLPY